MKILKTSSYIIMNITAEHEESYGMDTIIEMGKDLQKANRGETIVITEDSGKLMIILQGKIPLQAVPEE